MHYQEGSQHLLIRADASTAIGSGHIMRCIALAQAWQNQGGTALFVCHSTLPGSLKSRLDAEHFSLRLIDASPGSPQDARETLAIAGEIQPFALVLDGYHFDSGYQQLIKQGQFKLLTISDNAECDYYYADFVLNQNIHASESLYTDREDYTDLLLGTRYTLIRNEFQVWRGWNREVPEEIKHVLITMGGADPDNITQQVLSALLIPEFQRMRLTVIVGGSNPHRDDIINSLDEAYDVNILYNVSDMPDIMRQADIAITAGGSTVWELCLMGVPSIVIVIADNQQGLSQELLARDAIVSLFSTTTINANELRTVLQSVNQDYDRRVKLVQTIQNLIDGYGCERILSRLRDNKIWLRHVTSQDKELLWNWANDPVVRASAFATEPIPWESHITWFTKLMQRNTTILYVAFDHNDDPAGQIRFDIEDDRAIISITVDKDHRGRGFGTELLQLGVERFVAEQAIHEVHGFVKIDNISSQRIFEKNGFQKTGTETVRNTEVFRYVKLWRVSGIE